ncbi:hypothetical protein VTK56DRAFT_2626 [Thermocarpiscus australiensis]
MGLGITFIRPTRASKSDGIGERKLCLISLSIHRGSLVSDGDKEEAEPCCGNTASATGYPTPTEVHLSQTGIADNHGLSHNFHRTTRPILLNYQR